MQSLQNVLVLQRRENKNERRKKEKRERERQRVGCFWLLQDCSGFVHLALGGF